MSSLQKGGRKRLKPRRTARQQEGRGGVHRQCTRCAARAGHLDHKEHAPPPWHLVSVAQLHADPGGGRGCTGGLCSGRESFRQSEFKLRRQHNCLAYIPEVTHIGDFERTLPEVAVAPRRESLRACAENIQDTAGESRMSAEAAGHRMLTRLERTARPFLCTLHSYSLARPEKGASSVTCTFLCCLSQLTLWDIVPRLSPSPSCSPASGRIELFDVLAK